MKAFHLSIYDLDGREELLHVYEKDGLSAEWWAGYLSRQLSCNEDVSAIYVKTCRCPEILSICDKVTAETPS